jgi:L-iditol 2-dehydrogenase
VTSLRNLPASMHAVRAHAPGDLRLEQIPLPELGPGDALLKIAAVGICTTDRKIAKRGHFKLSDDAGPRVLGHELVGEIVAVGSRVTQLEPGTKVVVVPNLGCGHCPECAEGDIHLCANYGAFGITLDGAMAQYMYLPASALAVGNVLPIPAGISLEWAVLAEPLACCYNALALSRIQPGESLLVIGGGAMGLMNAALGRAFGASLVMLSDPHEERLDRAQQLGVDTCIQARQEDVVARVKSLTKGRGADVVIVTAASAQAQRDALECAARKGRINFFASVAANEDEVITPINRIHYEQLTLTGTTGANITHFRRVLELMASNRLPLEPLITARYPLTSAKEAFHEADRHHHARVVLEPNLASK